MQITKGQKRLLIALGLVLLYAVYDFIANRDQYLSYYLGADSTEVNVDKDVKQEDNIEVERNIYIKEWGSDPFREKVISTRKSNKRRKPAVKLHINGISYNGDNSIAIINNKIVKTGDLIYGYRVTKIEVRRVILTKKGKNFVLTLDSF